MKIVLAFEGMDGAGKTSLATYAKSLCEQHGRRYALIGRRESYSTPLVGRLTRLLHEEASNLSSTAETLIRLARDQERGNLAAAAPSGLVVLDRFVLSTLALVRFYGQEADTLFRIQRDIVCRSQLHATVFVTCSFETARQRVQERYQSRPTRRSRDERVLRRLADIMEEEFRRGTLTGQQWPVDNSGSLAAAQEQLAGYLLPYLQRGRPTRSEETPAESVSKMQHESV
jgi:thymidylate kinase